MSEPAELIHARIREKSNLIQKHVKRYKFWIPFKRQPIKAQVVFIPTTTLLLPVSATHDTGILVLHFVMWWEELDHSNKSTVNQLRLEEQEVF